jgi:hypothetical protein
LAVEDMPGASWKAQSQKFHYTGFTSYYTCEGLESKVRQILLHLGARKDLKVRATGCAYGLNEPSPYAWVEATFHALAPADSIAAAESVRTHWSNFQLSARRPIFMDAGECELIDQMREVIEKSFATRDLQYRSSCTPHHVGLSDYTVSGQVLEADKH